MTCLPLDSYTVNFRYWVDGAMRQVQADTPVFGIALAKVQAGEKACREHGYDYLAEIFPRLAAPIVTGTPKGLDHLKGLL